MQEDEPIKRPEPIEVEKEGVPDTKEEKDCVKRPDTIVKEYSEDFPKKDNEKS